MPVYVLTGANRGLGLEFVHQLSSTTSNTILAGVRSLQTTDLSDLKALNKNSNIHILECDVSDLSSITSFARSASSTLSGKKVDYLFNNSGINAVEAQNSLTIGPNDLDEHIRINVLAPAKIIESFLSSDLLSSKAVILNMTSGLGSMAMSSGMHPRKCTTYSISKAALNMLTVHLAGDLEAKLPDVVVIVMDPGWVKTRMGGEGAVLEPEESIGGMLKKVHALGKKDNGKFFTYTGEAVEW